MLSNKVLDARAALAALIQVGALSQNPESPNYPHEVASLANDIAEAMSNDQIKRGWFRSHLSSRGPRR